MKKVGILTFHRAHNYGAVLQCYALQEVLKGLGYDVKVIDYRQQYTEKLYAPFSIACFSEMLLHPRRMYRYLKSMPRRFNKKKLFYAFTTKWLNQTIPCTNSSIPQNIETYIVGSDQLWGLHCTGGIKDPVYFGNFDISPSSSIIGYAISTNQKSIESISAEVLSANCSNFTTLSFRELLISDTIREKCGVESRVDIDPTLLTNGSTWKAMINDKWANEKYVLLYQVRTPKGDNMLLNRKATELAQKLKCKVMDLSAMKYTVEDFVSLFKYAQCVVTSSFHASVFSVIFERPLQAVMLKDGHDGRYENILKAIGAEKMLVEMDFTPEKLNVDYAKIKAKLLALQQDSINYLGEI